MQRVSKNASLQTRSQDHAGVHEESVDFMSMQKYTDSPPTTMKDGMKTAGQGRVSCQDHTGVFGKSMY